MRLVYVVFCIVGWSWAAIVAALLLYLSSKPKPRLPGNADSPRGRKEA